MRRMMLASVAVSLLVGTLAAPASAAAGRTEFTANAAISSVSGGEVRESGESEILHILGRTFVFELTGDLTATLTAVVDFHLNFDTGNGTQSGTFVLSAQQVTWEGHFTGKLAGGLVESITLVGQGSDATKFTATMTQIGPGQFAIEGRILDPAA